MRRTYTYVGISLPRRRPGRDEAQSRETRDRWTFCEVVKFLGILILLEGFLSGVSGQTPLEGKGKVVHLEVSQGGVSQERDPFAYPPNVIKAFLSVVEEVRQRYDGS